MPYKNPDLTNQILPSTDQIKTYLRLANTLNEGMTRRDVRPLMSFLQRLCEVDQYLMGLVQSRKLAIKCYPFDIRMPLEYKITPLEEKQLIETKTRFRRSGMINVIDDIEDGILFGMSAVRLTYENTNYGTMVTSRSTYDLTELDHSSEIDGLYELVDNNGWYTPVELDPEIHILTRFNPLKNRKNFVGSYMRTAMLLSFLKYQTRWDWRDLNKRHGVPATYATHPDGLSDEEIAKLIVAVKALKNDSAAVFPDYVKILFDEALKNDNTNSFKEFISAANVELAILLHGQNLTTEVKQGSKAAAQIHNKVDDLFIESDVNRVAEIITAQYLKHDYLLNYGEPRNDFFEIVPVREEQEDYESNSRIITNILSDPEMREQLPLKKVEVYKKLNLTPPAKDDEVLQFKKVDKQITPDIPKQN
jgi:phage gp29-like protein